MILQEQVEFVNSFLTATPHRAGCAAVIADADIACTCGKMEAIKVFGNIKISTGGPSRDEIYDEGVKCGIDGAISLVGRFLDLTKEQRATLIAMLEQSYP